MNAEDVFSKIYDTDFWNGGSGVGSAPETTVVYREFLRRFLDGSGVKSVVDVGCGDWQLGSLVDWSGVTYTGVDVVPSVIAANKEKYGSESVQFVQMDVLNDREALPDTDVLLVKDVLQHWPTVECQSFLRWAARKYEWLVVTNDVSHVRSSRRLTNSDVKLGGWRPLDVEAKPFGFRSVYVEDYPVLDTWVKRIAVIRSFEWLRP
jgi:SAM-dependent methyltransferase